MANPYSTLKTAWHVDSIEALSLGEQPVPKQVHLILSDLCNQDCHFCAYRMSAGFTSENFGVKMDDGTINHNPNRMIPTAKAKELLADFVSMGVKAVQFTGGGEPTVHPQHIELFSYAQELGLETALVTNGSILRVGWQPIYTKMKWIRVSIDAGSPETYAKVRRVKPEMYEKALNHVADIAQAIKMADSDCVLGCGYVITPENWEEIARGVAGIAVNGAHNVRLTAMFSKDFDKPYEGIDEAIRYAIKRLKTQVNGPFQVIDLFSTRISDLNQHAPDYDTCGYQHFTTYIGADLKVYRCCTTSYTKHGEIGDLSGQSYREWFYSQQKQSAMSNFNARSCSICQFNEQNRVIDYMTAEAPLHVNFP